MPGQIYFQLRPQLAGLRGQLAEMNGMEVPKSLPFLEEQLARETDALSRIDIYLLLRDECLRAGHKQLEINYAKRCAEESAEPLPWINLADLLATEEETSTDAVVAATKAVDLARQKNRFIRHALCSLGRALWKNAQYSEVPRVLEELLADVGNEREEDGPFDFDFVVGLPKGIISDSLRQQYLELTRYSG